jgi:fibronectin-binding autotransporter adhesin
MKKFLLFISFCCLSATGFATTYINITNTDLNVASNWTSDGTIAGTAAPNFTTNLDVFNLDNDPGVQAWVGTFTLGAAASTVTLNINFTGSPVVFSGNLAIVKATSSLTTAAGATLDMATFTLANAGTFANSGTIRTAATGALPLPTAKTWLGAGTVEYYGTSSQTIVAGTYSGNVTISGNRGIQTLTFAAGTVSIGATLTFSATGSPLFTMTGNTITYANVTGGLTISSAIPYNNLTLGNTGNTNTPDGNITVAAALQATGGAGGTLDMGTNTLSVGTAVVTNTGIILTSNMSAFPLSTGKTWGGTVKYAAAGGGQTIASGTYATLTLLNSTSSDNAGGAITVNTALNTTSGGTFDMGTFLLAGTLTTVTNPGTIRTAASGATPVTTGKTWGSAAGTFEYYGTSSQTIVAGTYTNNLTISGDRTGQTLTFANGTIILSNALTYTATGSPTSITTSNTITYAKLTGGLTISSAIPYNNLNLNNTSGTNTADGALAIAGILNLGSAAAGTFANGGFNHTLAGNLTGSGTQTGVGKITMTGNNATINFTGVCGNLELNSTGFSLAANSTFNGVVTFTAGKLNLNAKTLTIAGAATSFPSMSAANCFTGSATSNMTVTATSNIGTIYFDQATPGGNQLSTFTISGIGGTTTLAASNPIAVTTLTLTAGTLADGGNTITLTGNLSGVGTHTGTGKIYMTGNPASISFTGNSGNLELDNVLGFSLAGNSTINGPLTCTNGKLALLNRTLTIGIGGTVSGMSAANSITGNGALSSLVITATANVGTLFFDQGTPGTTDNIGALTLTPAGAAMTLGSNISILTTLALTAATSSINDGGFIITNAGAITGAGVHTSTGSGKILMTGANKSIGTTVTLGNIELNSVGTSAFTLGGAVTINGALTFTGAANTLTIGANVLTLKGTVSGMSATQYFTGSATSNMTIGSTGALGVVFFNQTTPGTATTVGTTNNIATFTVNTGASVTLGSDLSISTSLALVGTGAIADGGFLIKDNGSITGTGTHTSTGSGKISVIGLNSSIANGAATYGNFEFNHLVASAFTMAGSPTITGTLTYTGAANTLTLGANTLTLNGTVAGMSATQFFTGSATSNLTLTNSGAVGTLFFGAEFQNDRRWYGYFRQFYD